MVQTPYLLKILLLDFNEGFFPLTTGRSCPDALKGAKGLHFFFHQPAQAASLSENIQRSWSLR